MLRPVSELTPAARRGRRVGQAIFFGFLTWVVVASAVEIVGETLVPARGARSAELCRDELSVLRSRLADAAMRAPGDSESVAVVAFREALGAESGRAWDLRVLELQDVCPKPEAAVAYALARLRAAHESMVRLDALEFSPARRAHHRALSELAHHRALSELAPARPLTGLPAAPAAPPPSIALPASTASVSTKAPPGATSPNTP